MNLNKSNHNSQPFRIFNDEASPCFSPLIGLNSSDLSFYEQSLFNFDLEENILQNYQNINYELENSYQDSLDSQRSLNQTIRSSDQEIKQDKIEVQTPSYIVKSSHSKVESIIRFLVQNDKLNEIQLRTVGKSLYKNIDTLQYVFQTFMIKFKKLKKTKEQMTKYCMRKAFKYVNDLKKGTKKRGYLLKEDKEIQQDDIEFQLPFKKKSSQKTMNNQFLRQIFSKKQFTIQYKKFLNQIHQLIQQDNNNKIIYLSNIIQQFINGNQIQKIQGIKRLPWTLSILKRTQNLAYNMIQFSQSTTQIIPLRFKKQKN